MAQSKVHHTPITSSNVKSELNTALGALDAAIGDIGGLGAAVFGEEVSDGTNGVNGSSGTYNVRNLAGLEVDPDGLIVIASDRFTPNAGTYWLMGVGANNPSHQNNRMELYNYTQSSSVFLGMSMGLDDAGCAPLLCVFTANGTDVYEIRHYTQSGGGSGLGLDDDATLGNEVYLETVLVRVGS